MFSSFMLKDGTQFVSPNIIKYPQTTHISIVRAENGIFSEPMKLSTMIVHKRYNFYLFVVEMLRWFSIFLFDPLKLPQLHKNEH